MGVGFFTHSCRRNKYATALVDMVLQSFIRENLLYTISCLTFSTVASLKVSVNSILFMIT